MREREGSSRPRSAGDSSRCDLTCVNRGGRKKKEKKDGRQTLLFSFYPPGGGVTASFYTGKDLSVWGRPPPRRIYAARALGGRAGACVAMRYSWYAPVSPMKRFTVIRL